MSTPTPFALPGPDLCGLLLDGRYELEAIIGEGAFGHVYRSLDHRLDRTVAVKLIKPWWASDPSWVHAFEREARLLARVNDAGIVQIFDVGRAPESLYYVAEFVDGESLAARLRRGPLDPWEAAEIGRQLCRALGRAHAARVVHRDIKPANVLLSRGGEVKLTDFGVARLAEDGGDASSSTMIAGTPKYMAPEHARGRPTSPASDTYSVGVVLYEMLAGVPPFTGTAAVDLALSHLRDAPAPLPDGTPRELARVVMRALAKDPEDRYQDGHAMELALGHARSSAAVHTREAPAVSLASHRAGAADATRREPERIRRNFNPAGRRRTIAAVGVALAVLAAMGIGAVLLSAPARVRVPQLRGLSRAAVIAKTRHLGLHPAFATRYDSAQAGTAIGQTPALGTRVDDGSVVHVVLSAGPPPVELPQLVGQRSSSATSILTSLGLNPTVTSLPAPGVQPGTVTAQLPSAGTYLKPHRTVVLSVAETPQWRPVTSFAGTDAGQSTPFRIRGTQWRVLYRMRFDGLCTFIFFCDGPSAQVERLSDGTTPASFGLGSGEDQTHVVKSGPGLYEIRIKPGNDTASWSVEVDDYY
jgi:hypothetical protein